MNRSITTLPCNTYTKVGVSRLKFIVSRGDTTPPEQVSRLSDSSSLTPKGLFFFQSDFRRRVGGYDQTTSVKPNWSGYWCTRLRKFMWRGMWTPREGRRQRDLSRMSIRGEPRQYSNSLGVGSEGLTHRVFFVPVDT